MCSHFRSTRRYVIFLVLVLAFVSVVGAQEGPICETMGGTIRVATGQQWPTLDMQSTTSFITAQIANQVQETLFAQNEAYRPQPMLAEGLEWSSDRTVATIHLREGVLFHNGEEMKADDVVASLLRYKTRSPIGQGDLAEVTAIESVDDYTVRVELSVPNSALPAILAAEGPLIMPAEIAEATMDRDLRADEIVGTGPFKIASATPNTVTLVRFDDYVARSDEPTGKAGRKAACLDTVVIEAVPEAATRVAGLESGDIDYAETVPTNSLERLSNAPGVATGVYKPGFLIMSAFNLYAPPFDNPENRRAVVMALNPAQMLRAATNNTEDMWQLDPSLMMKGTAYASDAGTELYNAQRVEEAKEILSENGAFDHTIKLLAAREREDMFIPAVVLSQQLQQLGFKTELVAPDWPTVLQIRTDPEAWSIYFTTTQVVPDPLNLKIFLYSEGGWFNNYGNPEMDELILELSRTTEFEARKEIWSQMQTLMYQDSPYIIYGDKFSAMAYSDQLGGVKPWLFMRFWNIWLNE